MRTNLLSFIIIVICLTGCTKHPSASNTNTSSNSQQEADGCGTGEWTQGNAVSRTQCLMQRDIGIAASTNFPDMALVKRTDAKLLVLSESYSDGEITQQQFMAQRQKILADGGVKVRKVAERYAKEKEKREQIEARQEKLRADKEKCDEYGFKRGTNAFAGCLMQLEQAKQQEKNQLQMLVAQQQMQQQAREEQENAQSIGQTQDVAQDLINRAAQPIQPVLLPPPQPSIRTNCIRMANGMVNCSTW